MKTLTSRQKRESFILGWIRKCGTRELRRFCERFGLEIDPKRFGVYDQVLDMEPGEVRRIERWIQKEMIF